MYVAPIYDDGTQIDCVASSFDMSVAAANAKHYKALGVRLSARLRSHRFFGLIFRRLFLATGGSMAEPYGESRE